MNGRYESPLRDLIIKLDSVARTHMAYPQATAAMNHLRDHLSALARCEEINRREAEEAGIRPDPHDYPPEKPKSDRWKPIEPGDPPRYLR